MNKLANEVKKYLVRANCEYTIVIHASNEEMALEEATKIPYTEWDTAWTSPEVDVESSEL